MAESFQFQPPFLVMGLARSRTAWLSKFLSYGPWVCGHEELRHCRSLEDVTSWLMQPFIGSCETTAAQWWRLIPKLAPACRVVTVRRPVMEVMNSIIEMGVSVADRPALLRTMQVADAKMDQLERRLPGVLSVQYADLGRPEVCKQIFEHCLLLPFDGQWWQQWNAIKVESDVRATVRYWFAYLPQTLRLMAEARHAILADMVTKKDTIGDGLVIQEERFESSFVDAQQLFEDHCVAVGEPPDEWTRDNIPVLQTMDKLGLLQIMTARANGKMFGYLVTMVGSMLSEAIDKSATHTLFYASKAWPGAGLRLQRAALAALKAKGVDNVYMRSGLGVGARVEILYKRLGAEPEGRLFKIKLGG